MFSPVPRDTDRQANEVVARPAKQPGMPRQLLPALWRQFLSAFLHGLLKAATQFGRECFVHYDKVGFFGQEQAERIDVGRTDSRPLLVDDRHLGVQEAVVVFKEMYASIQQLAVKGLRSVVKQAVFDASLKQDGHVNTPIGGLVQGAAETAAGQEVGVGDQDAFAGAGDGGEIGFLDIPAMPDVVAHEEGCLLISAG